MMTLTQVTCLEGFLKKGFITEIALNGSKGIARFAEDYFDIVLCDFRLRNMDGKNVLLKIKEVRP